MSEIPGTFRHYDEPPHAGSASGISYGVDPVNAQHERPSSNYNAPPPQAESPSNAQAESQLRTCRICLDTTTELVDPELGRMISPCKCRGSSRYVHQECLNLWRLNAANNKAYYECPTCKFKYKFSRLKWSKRIAGPAMNIGITLTILLITVYLLGFVGERLIDIFLPVHSVYSVFTGHGYNAFSYQSPVFQRKGPITNEPVGLAEHMLRGLASLGLLGLAKILLTIPQAWVRLIYPGNAGGRRAGGGRDRMAQLGWIVIAWGVINFLIVVWKFVRRRTQGVLDGLADNVLDVQEDEPVLDRPGANGVKTE